MSAGPEIVVEPEPVPAATVAARPVGIMPLIVIWAIVSLPALGMGFHADDWFHLRPRGLGEVLATFGGDWNSGVRGAGGFYRPLARASLSLDAAVFGRFAPAVHAVSAFVFLAVVLGVHAVAMQLTGGRRRCSLAAAALVAASPLKSEALYWVSARGDLLAAGFGLWSLWFALRAVERHAPRDAAAALLLLAGALLSKEVAIAFVLVVPLAVLLLRQPVEWSRTDAALVLLPPAMGAAWACFRASVLGGVGGYYGARGEPLALPEMLGNMGAMLSALAAPGTAFVSGHWVPLGALAWLGAAWLLLMVSRLRRTYVLCAAAVVASLAPMAGLHVTPLDGSRVLVVALCFNALFAGAVFAQFANSRLLRFVGTPVLGALVVFHVFLSLGRAETFLSAKSPNASVMEAAAGRIASAAPGERFLLVDPPDPAGTPRYLAPGMSLLMAMQAESERAGRAVHLNGIELITDRAGDATTTTLVRLEPRPDGTIEEHAYAAPSSSDLSEVVHAALPDGYALRESIARVALPGMSPAGLHRIVLRGTGEHPVAPRIECRGLDDHLAGSATAILTHAKGDAWEMTAYASTTEPFGMLVVAPTASPRRFRLLSVVHDAHPRVQAAPK